MADDYQPAIVIDNGSGICKAGISGDDFPRAYFQNQVGRPINPQLMVGGDQKDVFVGQECSAKKNMLNINYPVEHGLIENWVLSIWLGRYGEDLVPLL